MRLRARERTALEAFADALLPAGERLPAACALDVAGSVAAMLDSAPRRVRAAFRVALAVAELSALPRGFSRQPLERRTARLEKLEAAPGGVRRELFLLLKSLVSVAYARDPAVRARIGVEARCRRAGPDDVASSRLEQPALEPPSGVEHCDVVVVGSGAGGAAAARALSERGVSVIVVEEGDYHDARSYPSDPLGALASLYRDGGLTACEGRPAIPLPVGRCVGGTTVINSGTCFRTPSEILASWRAVHGIGWATDLDEQFEALERDLLVQPVDADSAGRNAALCRAGAEAIGASNGPIRRNAGDVVCCGTCPTGCELDAKQAAHVSELPRAVAAGCRVRAGARIERVLIEHGRATGVAGRSQHGAYQVRARAVVLAAGAIGTPELLLSQRLANSSGAVGRNLRIHPACWVGARFDEEVRGWEGVMQSWYVDEWRDHGLFLEATFTPFAFGAHWLPGVGAPYARRVADYGRLAVIGVHLSERSSGGRVRLSAGRARVGYRLSREDAAGIRFGIARAADLHFAAGAREVYPQIAGLQTIAPGMQLQAVERGRFGPSDLRLEAFHPMGTARMGADASATVVSPDGEAHDVPGLYVADASVFPTSLGVNPMITVMACARRIAAGVADRVV